jgi:hypothetical protein
METNLSQDSSEQHTSNDGYSSVYQDSIAAFARNFGEDIEVMRNPDYVLTISSLLRLDIFNPV